MFPVDLLIRDCFITWLIAKIDPEAWKAHNIFLFIIYFNAFTCNVNGISLAL